MSPGFYSIKDFAGAVYTLGYHEGTLQVKYDDITMRTKLVSTRFGGTFGTLIFDEKSFFNALLGFRPYWVYKPTNVIHAGSPGVYTSEKIPNISTIDKILLKCDVIDGSVVNGIGEPVVFSFLLDKPCGFNLFCDPETILYKKIKKSNLNTKTFYLEGDNHEKVDFIGITLTFTIQMIKI